MSLHVTACHCMPLHAKEAQDSRGLIMSSTEKNVRDLKVSMTRIFSINFILLLAYTGVFGHPKHRKWF